VSSLEERLARLERLVEAQQVIIEGKDAEIARLRARVEELERKLGENSSNSSKPPSSDSPAARENRPKDPPSGRRRGGQRGHKGHRRTLLPPAQVTHRQDCFPSACRRCGDELPRVSDPDPVVHQVIDVPPIKPDVRQFDCHNVTCPGCGATTCGTPPAGTPAGMLGPGVLSLVALLVAECHVSRRKVQALLLHLLGIRVSLGTLSESEEIVSDAVAAAVEQARLHALSERIKHVDATTWSCAGAYRCLWTMATAAVTIFFIASDGTKARLQAWMSKIRGVLVTDRGTQFGFWAMERRQICWAHLMRRFASFATRRGDAGKVGDHLLVWTRVLFHNWHRVRDGTMTRREFSDFAGRLRVVVERLLEEGARLPGIGGSCADILEHRAAMWRFVGDRGVEPTNNHAERELRGFVLWRKGCYGSQSERGITFAANLKSVVHTCRKQGRPVLPYLTAAVHAAFRGRAAPSLLLTP
jgi:transposase